MINFTRIAAPALLATICSTATFAQDSTQFSYNLGLIVGSAGVCKYKLNDDAVSAYVAANVPGSDLRFASNFTMHVNYHRHEVEEMTDLELRIHCEAALRSAEHLKLMAAPSN